MKTFSTLTSIAILAFATHAPAQGHGHINAGAADTNGSGDINAGDKLTMYFEHGTQTTTMVDNGGIGSFADDGFNWNGFTTLTSLHQSSVPSEAAFYSSVGALSGSFVTLQLNSITGPAGSRFAFYEAGSSDPTWVYQVGTGFTLGTGVIPLTEAAWFNDTPSNPFGHIHGRMFAVSAAGTYDAAWILIDTQSASTGLLDSDLITTTYIAAPEPGTAALLALGALALLTTASRRARESAAPVPSRAETASDSRQSPHISPC